MLTKESGVGVSMSLERKGLTRQPASSKEWNCDRVGFTTLRYQHNSFCMQMLIEYRGKGSKNPFR